MNKKIILILFMCISFYSTNINAQEKIETSENNKSIVEVTKYIKTETLYNNYTKKILETKETELSEEQYNMLDYKKITIREEKPNATNFKGKIIVTNTWKKVPSVKSYDIIAATFFYGMSDVSASLTSSVAQNAGSKTNPLGAGISAKLLNNISNNSTITLTITGKYSSMDYWYNGKICGTYQHAQSSVSQADSLAYSFSNTQGGVGNVLDFNSITVRDKYDKMQGICIN